MANVSQTHRSLRKVLSLPMVQDRVFGENSPGGLEWEDYNNVSGFVGPVIHQQGARGDRVFPLRCQERRIAANGNRSFTCYSLGSRQNPVARCEGKKRDVGAQPDARLDHLPATVQLRNLPSERFRIWDEPAQQHRHANHPICRRCVDGNAARRATAWTDQFLITGPNIRMHRYFRFCKKHSNLLVREPNLPPRVPGARPTCACLTRYENNARDVRAGRYKFKCDDCAEKENWDWQNRARQWQIDLWYTFKKRGRGKRAYVDRGGIARAKPVCPYPGCGVLGWYDTPLANTTGLSLCVACSHVVHC